MKKKKSTFIKIGVLAAAVILIGLLLARSLFSSGKPRKANLNQSYEVATGTVDSTVSATGNITMDDSTDVVAATGVLVKEVLVETGDEVKKGDVLAKLDKTSVVSELITAKDTKEDLEDQLDDDDLTSLEEEKIQGEIEEVNQRIQDLNKLHDDPVIKASVSGVVSSVNVSEGSEISNTGTGSLSGTTNSTDTSSQTSLIPTSKKSSPSVVNLSASTISNISKGKTEIKAAKADTFSVKATVLSAQGDGSSDGKDSESSKESGGSEQGESNTGDEDNNTESTDNTEDTKQQDNSQEDTGSKGGSETQEDSRKMITDLSTLSIAAPVAGQKAQSSIQSTGSYTGKITWTPSDSTFQAGKAYSATVILTARDGYVFRGNYEGATVLNDGKQLKFVRTFPKTAEADKSGGSNGPADDSSYGNQTTQSGQQTTQVPNQGTQGQSQSQYGNAGQGSYSLPGASSGSSLGSYGTGISSGTGTSGSTSEFYGTYRAAAFSINTRKNVSIVVSIDELDILSIKKGQTAKVALDALPDVEFEGTISRISTTATSSNGNTKYDVEISIPENENIMDGMSASVVIVTDSAENAVLIPVLALQERGEKQYVYTGEDEEGNLTDEVEVETGISDGTNVQITSGLSAGDTIYYQMATGDDLEQMMNENMQRNRDANMNNFGGGPGGSGQGGPGGNGGGPGNGGGGAQ